MVSLTYPSIAVFARQSANTNIITVPMPGNSADLGAQIIEADQQLGSGPGEIEVVASGVASEGEVTLSAGHDLVCEDSSITISLDAGSYLYQNSNTQISNCVISATSVPINGEIQSVDTTGLQLDNVTFNGGGNLLYWVGVSNFTISDNTVESITAFNPNTNAVQSGYYLVNCSQGEIDDLTVDPFVFPPGSNSSGVLGLNVSNNITVNNPVIQNVDASYVAFGAGAIVIAGSTQITINGGTITGNANMDGILSQAYGDTPSYGVTITGVNSSYNGAVGRNGGGGALGDGLDLINTGNISVSDCVLLGNGNPADQQPGIWIFIDDDVVVANCNISNGSRAGVAIAGSPDVSLINNSINGNQATGVYVEWQAGTATNEGAAVTFAAGVSGGFGLDWVAGTPFLLDGVKYPIASITDSEHLTLAVSPPNHSSPVQWAVNSTVQIIGDVIDNNGLAGTGGQQQVAISLADGTSAVISGVTATNTEGGIQLYALEFAQTAHAYLSQDNFSGNLEGGDGIEGLLDPVPLLGQPLVPTSAVPNGASFTLTVNGAGFTPTSVLNWNGAPLMTTFVNSDQLTAIVPASKITNFGTASVTVMPPPGGSGISNVGFFEIASPASSIRFTQLPPNPPLSGGVQAILSADFNGDGNLDLAYITEAPSNNVGVQLGNGAGSFQAPLTFSSGGFPSGIVAGDFNGDGKLDLAVTNGNDDTVAVFWGNGDGTFKDKATLPTAAYAGPIVVGDFNLDGKLDIAVGNGNASQVTVLLGNGDGTFQSPISSPTNIPANLLVTGDFNKDGEFDLVVGNGSYVSFLHGNGDGTFQSPTLSTADLGLVALVTADLNGDGNLDLIAADSGENNGGGGAFIMLGNGDGTFQSPVEYAAGRTSLDVVAQDFNADGKVDLVLANSAQNTSSILLGNGDGTFQNPIDFPASFSPSRIVAGDFNNDGMMDMALPSGSSSTSSVITFLQGTFAPVFLSPESVDFLGQFVGTGVTKTVTLTNNAANVLHITDVNISPAEFSAVSLCGSSVSPGSTCSLKISFAPATSGIRNGVLKVTDDGNGSPQTVTLTGIGEDFSVAASSSPTASVIPGQTASYTITVTPSGSLTGAITVTCSGEPVKSTCTLSPNPANLTGSNPATVTVTVTTAGTFAGSARLDWLRAGHLEAHLGMLLVCMPWLVLLGNPSSRQRKRKAVGLSVLVLACLSLTVLTMSACGGSAGGTPAGTYKLRVIATATSGESSLAHSVDLTLVVR